MSARCADGATDKRSGCMRVEGHAGIHIYEEFYARVVDEHDAHPRPTPTEAPKTDRAKMCGKVRFADKAGALRALSHLQRMKRRGDHNRREHHVYRCECGAWHLTSERT